MSQEECKYWEIGYKFMNCRYCPKINQDYCKDKFGPEGIKFCPRCGDFYLHHSLSRLDNETKICSNCGNWEAMIDYRFLIGIKGMENILITFEEINDKLNILGTLKGTKGKINNHEFRYFERIETLLNAKLETLNMSN